MVFEIVGGSRLLKFFQVEYFVALAGSDMNGMVMGIVLL